MAIFISVNRFINHFNIQFRSKNKKEQNYKEYSTNIECQSLEHGTKSQQKYNYMIEIQRFSLNHLSFIFRWIFFTVYRSFDQFINGILNNPDIRYNGCKKKSKFMCYQIKFQTMFTLISPSGTHRNRMLASVMVLFTLLRIFSN